MHGNQNQWQPANSKTLKPRGTFQFEWLIYYKGKRQMEIRTKIMSLLRKTVHSSLEHTEWSLAHESPRVSKIKMCT